MVLGSKISKVGGDRVCLQLTVTIILLDEINGGNCGETG